jgi:hypothetical protein
MFELRAEMLTRQAESAAREARRRSLLPAYAAIVEAEGTDAARYPGGQATSVGERVLRAGGEFRVTVGT